MYRRTLMTTALLSLAVATALPQTGFSQTDPRLGTWRLNLAKSKFSGPAPRSQTVNTEAAEGQNLKNTVTGVGANGNPINNTFTGIIDGVPHPVSNANFDTIASTRVDAYTMINSFMKAGKLVRTQTTVVSSDGKTITVTTIGINANGQPMNDIAFYDKQ
jgi:hypothetical protein